MPRGEAVIVNGSGFHTDPVALWGDSTSTNIDPVDTCRFWYVNQYYQTTSARGWQTRIAAFRLPGCTYRHQLRADWSKKADPLGLGLFCAGWAV
jgi:hypothetical protein